MKKSILVITFLVVIVLLSTGIVIASNVAQDEEYNPRSEYNRRAGVCRNTIDCVEDCEVLDCPRLEQEGYRGNGRNMRNNCCREI